MTDKEIKTIRELRMKGWGYGKIARHTGINEQTIKSHCRRHGLNGSAKDLPKKVKQEETNGQITYCKNCGAEIVQEPKRKKKIFCCDYCRHHWWNTHLNQVNRKAYYEFTCLNCGKEFRAYGDSRRKYCCHECYIEHRFGENTS